MNNVKKTEVVFMQFHSRGLEKLPFSDLRKMEKNQGVVFNGLH